MAGEHLGILRRGVRRLVHELMGAEWEALPWKWRVEKILAAPVVALGVLALDLACVVDGLQSVFRLCPDLAGSAWRMLWGMTGA